MFTTDVEDALIVKLAKKASVKPEECIVLSKTAGSVILEIAITASNSDDALAKGAVQGQVHFFPCIGNADQLRDEFIKNGCAKL